MPPPGGGVSSGFSVVAIAGRYWLIQAGSEPGSQDIDAYPASEPWGPFGAGVVLYRNPAIGLDAAHDYRIMYEARAEPALSTRDSLMISYNVNSEAVTTGCVPMSAFTNTVTQPRFISVPLAAFGTAADMPGRLPRPRSGRRAHRRVTRASCRGTRPSGSAPGATRTAARRCRASPQAPCTPVPAPGRSR